MNSMVRLASLFVLLACVGLLITSSGCSKNPATVKVTGKVTYDGKSVTSGSLTFSPVSGTEGKPAIGEVQSDGTYTLSTYAEGDGAVAGTHRVSYAAGGADTEEEEEEEGEAGSEPEGEHDETGGADEEVPFSGLIPKQTQVTVEAGGSTIDIELVAAASGGGGDDDTSSDGGEHGD